MTKATTTPASADRVTALLREWSRGDIEAGEEVASVIYVELRGVLRRTCVGREETTRYQIDGSRLKRCCHIAWLISTTCSRPVDLRPPRSCARRSARARVRVGAWLTHAVQ
jgi:hypothetical protein